MSAQTTAATTTMRVRCSHDGQITAGNPRLDAVQVTAIRTDHLVSQ